MLRLVFAIDSLSGGGAEKVVLTLVKALREQGHDAIIISLQNDTVYDVDSDIPLYYLYQDKRRKLYKSDERAQHAQAFTALVLSISARRGKIDHIFSNLDQTNYILAATAFNNVSYIIHNAVKETLIRNLTLGPRKYLRQRKLFKALEGKRLIAVSESLKHELQSLTMFSPHSVECIHNPFHIEQIRTLTGDEVDGLPKAPYMIHVGRMAKQKRHDVLFEALSMMPDEYRLVCLAYNTKRLVALAEKFGVADRVITPGFKQNPYVWIKHARCMVLSSDYEGLPTVIIESLICGTPVVATDCPHGPKEILSKLEQSYLVPRRSPKLLAEKVMECWQQTNSEPQATLHTARYSHTYIAQKYINFVRCQTRAQEYNVPSNVLITNGYK